MMIKTIKATDARVGDRIALYGGIPIGQMFVITSIDRKEKHTVCHTDAGPVCRYHDSNVFVERAPVDNGVSAWEKAAVLAMYGMFTM